jgi:serine/threonine protein kinase
VLYDKKSVSVSGYRDLKPANILLGTAGEAMLADFGVATVLSTTQHARTTIGTKAFMAPEVLAEEPYDDKVIGFVEGPVKAAASYTRQCRQTCGLWVLLCMR